jgi:hypothetical protein
MASAMRRVMAVWIHVGAAVLGRFRRAAEDGGGYKLPRPI